MSTRHALFDPSSRYGRMRSSIWPKDKMRGYFHSLKRRQQYGDRVPCPPAALSNRSFVFFVDRLDQPVEAQVEVKVSHKVASSQITVLFRVPPLLADAVSTFRDEPEPAKSNAPARVRAAALPFSGDVTVEPLYCKRDEHACQEDHDVSVASLPEGLVATCGSDHVIRLWEPHTGKVRTLHQHDGHMEAVVALPNGLVASASVDHTVKVLHPDTGEAQTMSEHSDAVTALATTRDGRVVSASRDCTVKLWNPLTGEVLTMAEHSEAVNSVDVSADGWVVSGSSDCKVKLWSPPSGRVRTMSEHTGKVTAVAILPDGRVVSGSDDCMVKLWDPASRRVETMSDHEAAITALSVLPDGRVVSGSQDGDVRMWDPDSGETTPMPYRRQSGISSLRSLPDARVASASDVVQVWDTVSGRVQTMRTPSGLHPVPISEGPPGGDFFPAEPVQPFLGRCGMDVLSDGRVVRVEDSFTLNLWQPLLARCRVLFVEPAVFHKLLSMDSLHTPAEAPSVFGRILKDEFLRDNADAARLLSAVPELDGTVDEMGIGICDAIEIPRSSPPLPQHLYIVVVIDQPAMG